jgi:hypothetical protein
MALDSLAGRGIKISREHQKLIAFAFFFVIFGPREVAHQNIAKRKKAFNPLARVSRGDSSPYKAMQEI